MYRDASGRLSYSTSALSFLDYPAVCQELTTAFKLIPDGGPVSDMVSVIFREYRRDEQAVELAWDNSMGFAVTAKNPSSEPLVEEITCWLAARQPLEK